MGNEETNQILTDLVVVLASTIEARDSYTHGHLRRTAEISKSLAQILELSEKTQDFVFFGALIHDIGKISLPSELLNKAGSLTVNEFNLLKEHPERGFNILISHSNRKKYSLEENGHITKFPWPIETIVIQHHERLDGTGYPFGLKDKEIKLESQIVAVADVFEAMTSLRPYRMAMNPLIVIDNMLKEIGKLNKEIILALEKLVENRIEKGVLNETSYLRTDW